MEVDEVKVEEEKKQTTKRRRANKGKGTIQQTLDGQESLSEMPKPKR